MDDRKRQIDELEKKKRDNTVLLDGLLTRLGEGFFDRIPDDAGEDPTAELKEYLRLQNDIAGSDVAIQVIEEQLQKLKELEASIALKEKEDKACSRELAKVYGILGKQLLDSPSGKGDDFCAPYRSQAEALSIKVQSLEERLSGLERKEGGNVFTWLGNSAQSLVLRSFLTRALENLESLYRSAGERYSRREFAGDAGLSADIEELCGGIERKRSESKAVSQELAALKEERREMSDSLNAEGNPVKHIQSLKKHIAGVRDEVKALYRRVGAGAVGIGGTADGSNSELRQFVDALIIPADRETMDNAARISQSIQSDEKSIGRLRASLAIDEEHAKIEKFRRMILDKREKIARAEKSITDYEEGIADCEKYIEKLRELL